MKENNNNLYINPFSKKEKGETEQKDIDEDEDEGCFNLNQITEKFFIEEKEEENKKFLSKKRKSKETDIIYNADSKSFENAFIPNLEELNNFLKNCTIKEIKMENIEEEIEKIPKEKVFDPGLFIKENYGKEKNNMNYNLSLEDLDLNFNNKEEEIKEIGEYNYEKSNLNDINDINSLNDIHKLIEKIKNMNVEKIKEINGNKKLNIVFDFDNTCIYSRILNYQYAKEIQKKYPEKEIRIIKFEYNSQILFAALLIRKGINEFIEYTKSFCNYYINTLGFENYGLKIKEALENICKINFLKIKARRNDTENAKFLFDLSLDANNTIIFDDRIDVWIKNYLNVISSKIFRDNQIIFDSLKVSNLENNIDLFFKGNSYFSYYESEFLKIIKCPFCDFNKKECYCWEYLNSNEFQFIYMKDVIKIIYYLVYKLNKSATEALKLIRCDIFYNYSFNLNYYDDKNKKKLIKKIIENSGGIVIDNNNNKQLNNNKLFFVCTEEDYNNKYKDEIKKEQFLVENSRVIKDEFILNSFFFMTNLDKESDNNKYYLDGDNEDNFDGY